MTCANGCASEGGAHCRAVVLSNGLDAALVADLSDFRVSNCADPLTFSELGEIKHGASIMRTAGEGVNNGLGFGVVNGFAVYAFDEFEIVSCNVSSASGGRLALAAATSLVITGATIYGSGAGGCQAATSGCTSGGSKTYSAGGGGGTAGGAGGDNSTAAGGGGAAGAACGAMHVPLRAGSSGGLGDGSPGTHNYYGLAGSPGAALRLGSRGAVTITGSNFFFGGGGGGPAAINLPAGGGGSGGSVFIEGDSVIFTYSSIFANGGNGGIPTGYGAAARSTTRPAPARISRSTVSRWASAARSAPSACTATASIPPAPRAAPRWSPPCRRCTERWADSPMAGATKLLLVPVIADVAARMVVQAGEP